MTGQIDNSGRLHGIDAARGLAVIGMTMVHVGPSSAGGLAGVLYGLPHGRASVLFVLVAGIGAALLSRHRDRWFEARLRLLWVAALFFIIGIALQLLDHGVAVILHHYAAFYLLALLLFSLPRFALAVLGMLATFGAPAVYFFLRRLLPEDVERQTVGWGDALGEILAGITLTGPYPLLTWGAIIIWGFWIGRKHIATPRGQTFLMLGGLGVALVAELASLALLNVFGQPENNADWRTLLIADGHSQMPFWLMSSIGSAGAIVGLALLVARHWRPLIWPLAALGQVALTYYIAHLLALYFFEDRLRFDDIRHAVPSALMLAAAGIGFAILWRRHFRRGPVEWLMALPFDRHRHEVQKRI